MKVIVSFFDQYTLISKFQTVNNQPLKVESANLISDAIYCSFLKCSSVQLNEEYAPYKTTFHLPSIYADINQIHEHTYSLCLVHTNCALVAL